MQKYLFNHEKKKTKACFSFFLQLMKPETQHTQPYYILNSAVTLHQSTDTGQTRPLYFYRCDRNLLVNATRMHEACREHTCHKLCSKSNKYSHVFMIKMTNQTKKQKHFLIHSASISTQKNEKYF